MNSESEIIGKINRIISKINKNPEFNIEFLGFVGGKFNGRKDTKIILKDNDFDQIESINLRHLLDNKRWYCQKRTNLKIGKAQHRLPKDEAIKIIEAKVNEINNLPENKLAGRSIKFLGINGDWIGANKSKLDILCNK